MTTRPASRPYTRHGLNAPMARVKLRGFRAIDRRTTAARETLGFRSELLSALGGEADLSPQRRRLVDLAARASLLVDHVDAWLFEQRSLINARARTLLPVLVQRQALADHLARLLDRLGLDRVPQRVPTLTEYLAGRRGSDRPSANGEPEQVDTATNGGPARASETTDRPVTDRRTTNRLTDRDTKLAATDRPTEEDTR